MSKEPVCELWRLLVFNCLTDDDPRSGLAEIRAFAFVCVELLLDSCLCFPLLDVGMKLRRELHVAVFANSEHWNVLDAPNDAKIPLCHDDSLRRR
jgi:hypothetical protein